MIIEERYGQDSVMGVPATLSECAEGDHDLSANRTIELNIGYTCDLSPLHVDATLFPDMPSLHPVEEFELWHSSFERTEDKNGQLAAWINYTIRQLPGGVELSRDVDDGGYTHDKVDPSLFTKWVRFDNESNLYVRFSQARTAMHGSLPLSHLPGGALRTPVMGGVALECTTDPSSKDPRNAVSVAIYEYARQYNANFPWLKPRAGRIFDMSSYQEIPYFAGPLNGHPNEIIEPQKLETARSNAVEILQRITRA